MIQPFKLLVSFSLWLVSPRLSLLGCMLLIKLDSCFFLTCSLIGLGGTVLSTRSFKGFDLFGCFLRCLLMFFGLLFVVVMVS